MNKGTEELIARKGNSVTGSYYLAKCENCEEFFTSESMSGGEPLYSGDYSQCYCPKCGTDDSEISDYGNDAAEAWNVQQKYIDALIAALEQAQQRIYELENDEVRQHLANAEHQLYMAELAKYNLRTSRRAQFRKRLAAEKRIAELEIQNAVSDASIIELKAQYETVRSASQLSVKLPAHKYRECVNGLLEEAIAYAGTQQLRERISSRLANFVQPDHPHTRYAGGTVEGSD